MSRDRFSNRFGFGLTKSEITIREDAPAELRDFIVQLYYELGRQPSSLRFFVCRVLRTPADSGNWSEYPNIDGEVRELIHSCSWFKVYDIIERICEALIEDQYYPHFQEFTSEINEYFIEKGIGWKINENGKIESRGTDAFETAIHKVSAVLEEKKLSTARTEISEAIKDLSRRPIPDLTGAIQHSLACLECVCREAIGNRKATLGDLMKKATGIIPAPLDKAIEMIWGFSSEQGRHLKEGLPPQFLEAELVVELCAALSNYIAQKIPKPETPQSFDDNDELPF